MATVVLLGTFDTKGEEYAWLRDHVDQAYTKAWEAARQLQTPHQEVVWLQMLASMLAVARY